LEVPEEREGKREKGFSKARDLKKLVVYGG